MRCILCCKLVKYSKLLGSVKMKIYNKFICVITYSLSKYNNFINLKSIKMDSDTLSRSFRNTGMSRNKYIPI